MSFRSALSALAIASMATAVLAGPAGAQQNPTKPYVPSVVDANGKFVGPLIGDSLVLYKLNGVYVAIRITADGFDTRDAGDPHAYYTSTDCSGQQYSLITTGGIPVPTTVSKGRLYFPNKPVTQTTLRSESSGGKCNVLSPPFVDYAGPRNSRSFDALGNYVPPFDIQ